MYTVQRGDRIAQLVVQAVDASAFDVVDALPDSERGLRGFGSSGT
jgi:dUTP pyrophosphatase